MRPRRKRRCPSPEEEDDLPLKIIRAQNGYHEDPNSYDSLSTPSSQPCELCDRVSKNRYSSYIHNVKHIIIPLINQKVYQCELCLYHFTSQLDLSMHKFQKHAINNVKKSSPIYISDDEDLILEDLVTVVKEENTSFDTLKSTKNVSDSNKVSIKSRLLFEEDVVPSNCFKLLSDLTTVCKVNVELFPSMFGSQLSQFTESVHYDELVKPGVFRCKKCLRFFPCRFDAIIHEATHIIFINSQVTLCKLCHLYILGDNNKLKQHQLALHPSLINKAPLKKYFGGIRNENYMFDRLQKKIGYVKLCDRCVMMCNKNNMCTYSIIDDLFQSRKKLACEKCGYSFHRLNMVTVKSAIKSIDKKKRTHGITNMDRLKNITKRIKIMNKRYLIVLFGSVILVLVTLTTKPIVVGSIPTLDRVCIVWVLISTRDFRRYS